MMQLKMPCSIVKCLNQEGPSYDNRIGYRISVSPSVHVVLEASPFPGNGMSQCGSHWHMMGPMAVKFQCCLPLSSVRVVN